MDWIVSLPDRLDAFLASDGRMLSRAKAQKAIEEGHVRVNDEVVRKAAHRLQEGDAVALRDTEDRKQDSVIQPVDLHVPILYEDEACLVLNKSASIAVHPGSGMAPGEVTLLSGIAHLYKERGLPFSTESVLVHRLDKETTGCILVAKTPAAHLFLQGQFEERTVKKHYLALVAGIPKLLTATVDAPIGRSISDRTQMTVFHAGKTRDARTTYRVLATGKDAALLECDLHTGRTHQVRVHLHSIGHPVLGDPSYTSVLSDRLRDEQDIRGLCLHAWKLTFVSPADGREHQVIAGAPQEFTRSLEKAGVHWN